MEDKMHSWWIVAMAPVLAGLGYLTRRAIEGRRRSEKLKRRLQALALLQGMKRAGLTVRELDQMSGEK
jgi:hypothetical protein